MRSNRRPLTLLLAVCALALLAALPATASSGKTLENLQTAYNGESNAHAKYAAFALKADQEGYGAVASLFRAAARAEEIHAARHAEVIKTLGGTPKATIETPAVKSTRENLQAAIQGESYERDQMYPEFLKAARAEGNRDALKSFNQAKTAEAEHAKLYQKALDGLANLKGSKAKDYYVCGQCGYTVEKVDFAKCPSCFGPKKDYAKVA